jgi:hypothetical protein
LSLILQDLLSFQPASQRLIILWLAAAVGQEAVEVGTKLEVVAAALVVLEPEQPFL